MDKYIELHSHFDGAITPDIAHELEKILGLKTLTPMAELEKKLSVTSDCGDLNDFLRCFEFPLSLLQTKETISEAMRLEQEAMKKEGVVYAEIRFAPQSHTNGNLDAEDVIKAALDGLRKSDLECNLILCCMRGAEYEKNMEVIDLAEKYLVKNGGVTAIDLAGAEAVFRTSDYVGLFEEAQRKGIPYTIHAGEADGAESIRCALDMGAGRIGHGVTLFEDEELIKRVIDEEIVLEMCPTSNRLTNAVDDMDDYPLKMYLQKGIKVTLNTDDKAICRTTLPKEYEYVEKKYGITREHRRQMYMNAVDAAFTDNATKEYLRSIFDK